MAPSVGLWLCLYLQLLFTDAKSVGQHDREHDNMENPPSHLKLIPVWTTAQLRSQKNTNIPNQSPALPKALGLDVDEHRRMARGADTEDQQPTSSSENESVTAPQATELNNLTKVAAGNSGNADDDFGHRGNMSHPDHVGPGLFNPFYPLAESSYAAYAVLFLAGLVLAVGVVGNMAVMCIVWNNYYMRSAWNYLLASMAFWDFLVLVFCLPVVVLNQLSHRRILGDITCCMVPYMEVGVMSVRLGNVNATDLYLKVTHTIVECQKYKRLHPLPSRYKAYFYKTLSWWWRYSKGKARVSLRPNCFLALKNKQLFKCYTETESNNELPLITIMSIYLEPDLLSHLCEKLTVRKRAEVMFIYTIPQTTGSYKLN